MDRLTLSWLLSLNLLPDDERFHHSSNLAHSHHPGIEKSSRTNLSAKCSNSQPLAIPFPVLPCVLCPACGAIMLWPGAQQQPSGNGLTLLRELPVHFAIDYRGWTPTSPHLFPCFPTHLSSPSIKMTLLQTVGLHRYEYTAIMNLLCGKYHTCTQKHMQHCCCINILYQIRYQTAHRASHCFSRD